MMNKSTALPTYLRVEKERIEGWARAYGLDFFETIFEVLDYQRMNEVAAYGGFPVRYPHWRFGMEYERLAKGYTYGLSKIYEMVINNDPCYAYLLEGNSTVDQKMVMAHVYAHCDFFKNNAFFAKTNRRMIDGMANHAARIRRHIERHGLDKVESFVDACLSLDNLIDPHAEAIVRRAPQRGPSERAWEEPAPEPGGVEVPRIRAKEYMDHFINPPDFLSRQRDRMEQQRQRKEQPRIPEQPEADVLLFLLEHAPLERWERDVLEILRAEAYYFAPQRMTKIMNEGWATYWHSRIMTERALDASEVVDYADHAAGVLATSGRQLNPYKLGVALYRHVEERWNKGQFGKDWDECLDFEARRQWDRKLGLGQQKIFEVRRLYSDLTFIDEFFTEEFCRESRLFTFEWNERNGRWEIDSRAFREVKDKLLAQLTNGGQPFIFVEEGNFENRGELLLRHRHEGTDLRMDYARDVLIQLHRAWKRPVNLHTRIDGKGRIVRYDGRDHSEKAAEFSPREHRLS